MSEPRTTSKAVEAILRDDYDGCTKLGPFIATANNIINRVKQCAADDGMTIDDGTLELMERWLAAFCYTQSDPTYQSKSTAGASATFQGQAGMYLESNRYGQMCISLDPSGCLAAITMGTRRVASASWLGRVPSEQTDYYLRR